MTIQLSGLPSSSGDSLDPDHEGSSDTLDENDHTMVNLDWCILINDTVAF